MDFGPFYSKKMTSKWILVECVGSEAEPNGLFRFQNRYLFFGSEPEPEPNSARNRFRTETPHWKRIRASRKKAV